MNVFFLLLLSIGLIKDTFVSFSHSFFFLTLFTKNTTKMKNTSNEKEDDQKKQHKLISINASYLSYLQ